MVTYQDYLIWVGQGGEMPAFVEFAISEHKRTDAFKTATLADLYDRQKNKTINEYVRTIYTMAGTEMEDFTATNSKIASNFFHRLNTQRCTYSLGNGITFSDDAGGAVKERLGDKFDKSVFDAAYYALIHGSSFGFWNVDKLHVFPLTEFVPLYDEMDSSLKAGIRFWQIDNAKPMVAVFYELDGYTKMRTVEYEERAAGGIIRKTRKLQIFEEKRPYQINFAKNDVGDVEVIGVATYSQLPIVPMWGSRLKQSTLIGMQQAIDSFDLIRSGFANDLSDCAQIYWLLSNYGGMTQGDLEKFRDRMKLHHVVEAPDSGSVQPFTQEVPYNARKAYLDDIRAGIYEDFGGLDVHTVSANSTNDHLEAAYQPMDENADDFEYQCGEFIQQILKIAGMEKAGYPVFKRNKISNTKEQVDIVMAEASYLDDETLLNKLPNITPEEVSKIMDRRNLEDAQRMGSFVRNDETE